jgi:hypothetical protein
MDCAICLEAIDATNPGLPKWSCRHEFHKRCADIWSYGGNSCPLCRETRSNVLSKVVHPAPDMSPEYIVSYSQLIHVPEQYSHIYHEKWPYQKCHRENHPIMFVKPFGVIGICMTCRISQCYCLEHPVE